jgi:hypothetical protein
MLDMLQLSRRTSIWPERDVIKYIRSAIAIDGLITRFAPTFNVGRHLETVCQEYLGSEFLRTIFSYDALVGWFGANTHLIRDGASRAANLLYRVASGELPVRAELCHLGAGADGAPRQRAIQLGVIVLGVSLLMSVPANHVRLGVNLFTAGAVLVVAAATMIFQTIRRLT